MSSMDQMIEKAISLGLEGIAITDHYDPDFINPDFDYVLDFESYFQALLNAEHLYGSSIDVIKSIELGIQHGDTLKKCNDAVSAFPYDFILGAFHCAEGFDIWESAYFKGRSIEETYRGFYTYLFETLKTFNDYDVIAHINVIDRYAPSIPDFETYSDIVEKTIHQIIKDGKGIEINTSSERHGMGGLCTPTQELLNLYTAAGGEIITIGSDAHRAVDIGYAFDRAEEMILRAGLKYMAVYKDRKVRFIRI
jgi:histidinol-phosphatase (PHP family)